MELYKEILSTMLAKEEMVITFPWLGQTSSELVESECYRALQKIKTIIENDSLSDFECIEQIVCVLEKVGSDGGNRHDFG